jgi:hypothetical protein
MDFLYCNRAGLNQCRDTPHEPKTLLMIKKKIASETKTIDSNLKPMAPYLQNNAVYLENNQSEPTQQGRLSKRDVVNVSLHITFLFASRQL